MKTNSFTKRFTKKLKSNTGASILLALAFFLMCFFVASVVMASASVNASRALAQKEEQRSFFAIQSAQNLIKDMFGQINGANRVDNRKEITNVDGVTARAIGGFHLRDEKISYSLCDCPSAHNYFGLWTDAGGLVSDSPAVVVNGTTGVINFTPATGSFASFGLNCVGDNDTVFLKAPLEEVAMYAMSKRLSDEGIRKFDPRNGVMTATDSLKAFIDAFAKVTDGAVPFKFNDLEYSFDIVPDDDDALHLKNLPTVHVTMTTDEKANLTFRMSVDSRFSSTYSATLTAHSSFESLTPAGYSSEPIEETCPIGGDGAQHIKRTTVVDTYLTWYTDDIEISKGLKPIQSDEESSTVASDVSGS